MCVEAEGLELKITLKNNHHLFSGVEIIRLRTIITGQCQLLFNCKKTLVSLFFREKQTGLGIESVLSSVRAAVTT